MKKFLFVLLIVTVAACNDVSKREGGTINDGIKAVDTNGALNNNGGPLTDSTNNAVENKTRTDISQRDTFKTQGQ